MRVASILFFFFVSTVGSFAQKIKYKDLFFILDTKKYDQAEPILRKFLQDSKNASHPNGNLQMAFIYHDKASANDILKETEEFVTNADSALIYYGLAGQYITEKEIKKNDEYYQAYQRRDLRTGKFGIKLADVLFDLENKSKELKERKELVQELKIYFNKAKINADLALNEYKKINEDYPTIKILYLRANDDLLSRVKLVEEKSDLALKNYEAFESTLKKISKSGYGPVMHIQEIENYGRDGLTTIDFTEDNIDYWDYKKWAESVRTGVRDIVTPMRTELVGYGDELNALIKRVRTDSMAMADRIPPFEELLGKIREYDNDPLPEFIFKYKIADIESESYKMEHLFYRDSSDILYQLEVATKRYDYVKEMDSLVNLLISRDLSEDEQNYASYIKSQYEDVSGLQGYIKDQLDAVIYAKKNSESEIEALVERSRWLIGENDSIPLFEEVNVGLSKYVPLELTDDYTTGLYFSGETPAKGYFATINNTRSQTLRVDFEIDTKQFKKQNIESIATFVANDNDTHYYVVMYYIPLPEQEEFAASIAKIYTSDGLAWEKDVTLATTPKSVLINNNTGDVVIEYDMENYLGEKEIDNRLLLTKKGDIK